MPDCRAVDAGVLCFAMTPLEELLGGLRQAVGRRQDGHIQPLTGYAYLCMEDFVLKHGREYRVQPLASAYERGAPRECFNNSLHGVTRYNLRYVEGFALARSGMLPTHHAWNADAKGRVIDLTWDQDRGVAYFGVEFPTLTAMQSMYGNHSKGVLDDWEHGFPILREPWANQGSS